MVSYLLQWKFILAYAILGFALYTHLRGNVRLSFSRQLFNHSTLFAPYNVLMDLFSAVPNQPVWKREEFPHLNVIQENWEVFREEAMALNSQEHIRVAENKNDIAFNSFFRTGWKRFYIKWYDDVMPSAESLCPRSVEIVKSVPEINAAMFAMLPPDGRLGKHRDPFAGSLRYHLGLDTPNSDDCYIWIDDQFYSWRDGEDIVFDETYVHSAMNKTDKNRIILFCDVTRPLKTGFMRKLNQFVIDKCLRVTKSSNTGEEKVGFLNHLSTGLFNIKTLSTRMKKWNRGLYYTMKYSLIALLVYWIFLSDLIS